MKYLLIILCLVPLQLMAQPSCLNHSGTRVYAGLEHPDNIVFGTFQATDAGYGVGYIRSLTSSLGLYFSGSYGEYYVPGLSREYKDVPHYKIASGIVHGGQVLPDLRCNFILGLSYHDFWGIKDYDWIKTVYDKYNRHSKMSHFSCEFGSAVTLWNWLYVGFRWDWIRVESNIDVGISF
jgi:hypothetical protein